MVVCVNGIEYRLGSWEEIVGPVADADLVICDPIYENPDLSYLDLAFRVARPGAAIWVFGDDSKIAETKIALDQLGARFQNWCIWPNDWGGRSRRKFGQKHDDLLFYTKPGAEHTFNADAVMIPKQMVSSTFNPSGRTHKIPPSVWSDLGNFSTTAGERVKIDGRSVRWQKPERIIERIVLACSNPGDLVVDMFGGVATTPVVCARHGRRCVSAEIDPVVFAAGRDRLESALAAARD
jgi:site-specific DNA-methyltransferase (adenine-specific)